MIQNLVDNKNVTIGELNEKLTKEKEKLEKAEKRHEEEMESARVERETAVRVREERIVALEAELRAGRDELTRVREENEIRAEIANENFKNQLATYTDLVDKLNVEKSQMDQRALALVSLN